MWRSVTAQFLTKVLARRRKGLSTVSCEEWPEIAEEWPEGAEAN